MILNLKFLHGARDAQIIPHQCRLAIGCLEGGTTVTEASKNTRCDLRTVPNLEHCFKDTNISMTSTDPEDLAERH